MKNLVLLLIVLIGGCQVPKIEAPAESKVSNIVQQKSDPRDKPERLYQLKDLETRKMTFNGHQLTVWLMDDSGKRAEGMMYLVDKDVKDTEGMLFIFSDSEPRSFWMQNCPLGLDICYLDAKGKVLNVGVGKPFDESGVPSKGPAKYVLELKVGRAKKFGIKEGSILMLPENISPKE